MTEAPRYDGSFFGRRHGKQLRKGRAETMADALPRLSVDPETLPTDLTDLFDSPVGEVRLEIGFGGAEHLLHRAGEAPNVGFIGVEPFFDGLAKGVAGVERLGLKNVRLFGDDATLLLDRLPEASLTGVDLLYPDPWPKTRHWKRRFVNDRNLARLARVVKPGSLFRFASDIDTYVSWTLAHVARSPDFVWTAERPADWREPFAGWPGTRYERKAIREGRRGTYLAFRRT
ncbi:tRNA (guanine(46)-N(7))-methyltransferase TrmB [Chenggangzhangella methanolivorans]|uniref:tRNA (guanine-N(7)-)-methyltransferase n=1 Tax=Chenggangzhangella methanolivorans TaxID=1437009 RepID=A0A9E6R7U5_9HYPH|nr:tRNA (guanosine(46)-N(7))-methyltransferase TrmB [Chenggangzhangella methanolivorans]QZN98448.1 tRNA (guanosine(46)-N(7))-methyltransferase TrmB [Chenggangzhangella methanolivorans]